MDAIDADIWRAELERLLSSSGDEGFAAEEISKALGASLKTTYERLRILADAGLLAVGHRRVQRIDGRASWRPVYRLKKEGT